MAKPHAKDKDPLEALRLLEDEPVPDHDTDELGLEPFSRTVAGVAVGTPGPFTIGVFGDWGFGKTSVLRQARSLIDRDPEHKHVVTVWFNAWQYEKEEGTLVVPLIATIVRAIEQKPRKALRATNKACQSLSRALRAIAYGFSAKAEAGVPGFGKLETGFVAKEVIERYQQLKEADDPLLQRSLYYDAFETLDELGKAWRGDEQKAPRVVVFVDDLDRCLPDNGLKLLESIKLVLAQPGFVFVLAVDRPVLEDYLVKRYREEFGLEEPEKGRHYLDKIVQLPFPLPSHEKRFEQYLEDLVAERPALKDAPGVSDILRELREVLAIGSAYNPRNLVRLINNVLVDHHTFSLRGGEEHMGMREQEFLGTIVVSRALRLHLGLRTSVYRRLVDSDRLCEALAAEQGPPLHERVGEAQRPGFGKDLAQALELQDFLPRLLGTQLGRAWLTHHERRREVDEFLAVQRPETVRPSESGAAIIDAAIRKALGKQRSEPIASDELKEVAQLSLRGMPVEDAHLPRVQDLTGLQVLQLSATRVTDAGLGHLKALTQLQRLDLTDTRVGDVGLERLVGLTALEDLRLERTQVTSRGAEHLAKLPRLMRVDLDGTAMGDDGLRHLITLTNLCQLWLPKTPVTDGGLVHLKGLESLEELDLSFTHVSDAGLAHLKGLASLQELGLIDTYVTQPGVAELKKALPDCHIHF